MDRLGFGMAGFPAGASKKDPVGAIRLVHEKGLDCLELEFAHGLRMKDDTAEEINRMAKKLGVTLTAHAPYYINLNAKEQDKIDASISRLLQTARLAGMCGAFSMTFHAAFYMKDDPRTVFDIVKRYLHQIAERLKDEENTIQLRPELTGRKSQFGSLEELCALSKEVPQVYPCLDFTHIQFETGKATDAMNNHAFFSEVFERHKKALGKASLTEVHMHVGSAAQGPKGESKPIALRESTFNYRDFLKACRDFGVRGSVICEGPDQEADALMLKKAWTSLGTAKSAKTRKAS